MIKKYVSIKLKGVKNGEIREKSHTININFENKINKQTIETITCKWIQNNMISVEPIISYAVRKSAEEEIDGFNVTSTNEILKAEFEYV